MLLSNNYGHRTFSVRIVFSCRNIVTGRRLATRRATDHSSHYSIGQLARSNEYLSRWT